ncbi:MAG: hypothetical protein ABIW33_07715 [Sphingomicrobium sp.]
MRALILLAGAFLALTACNKHDQAGTAQKSDESLSADAIVANDVTAIDAVTADAANMAADVDYEALDPSAGNDGNAADLPAKHRSATPPAPKPSTRASKPATSVSPPANSD